MDLLSLSTRRRKPKPEQGTCAFIFDWDVDEQTGTIVGIIRDEGLVGLDGRREPGSSLVRWDLDMVGWEAFIDRKYTDDGFVHALNVSGRYRWEGTYWASQDYEGDWDTGWDIVSFEPADRKTRKAVEAYGPGWDEFPREV